MLPDNTEVAHLGRYLNYKKSKANISQIFDNVD